MFSKAATESLMARIREGGKLRQSEKLNLIIQLSIPSMLAQISNVLMFFIDAAMVGSLGAEASASIGLVESAGWLFGSLTSAAAVGFSVQTAHFIGANDFKNARRVMRHGYIFCLLFSLVLMAAAVGIAPYLPVWLHGEPGIRHDATVYFLIFGLAAPFFTLENLSSSMLKASGDMRHPSAIAIVMCVLDVAFNFLFYLPHPTLTLAGAHLHHAGHGTGCGRRRAGHVPGVHRHSRAAHLLCRVQEQHTGVEARRRALQMGQHVHRQGHEDKRAHGSAVCPDERSTDSEHASWLRWAT